MYGGARIHSLSMLLTRSPNYSQLEPWRGNLTKGSDQPRLTRNLKIRGSDVELGVELVEETVEGEKETAVLL